MLDPRTPSLIVSGDDPLDLSDPIYNDWDLVADFDPEPTPPAAPCWRDQLQAGDVVLFVYPIRLPGDGDLPKTRPCLVLDIERRGGTSYAVLAYGTSADSDANRGYEVSVTSAAEVAAAGLTRPTRFVGFRRLMVPLASSDFRPIPSTGSPVIGRLGPAARKRMNAVRGRIHAEADIARERRAQARRERQTRRSPRPVTVERIASRRAGLSQMQRPRESALPTLAREDRERRARPILNLVRTTDLKEDSA